MRIVNGRLHNDKSVGRMTCYTHNGESVVDYVLTEPLNFQIISNFKVGDFTEYSNHAPISFSLKTFTNRINDPTKERHYYKWDDKYKNDFLTDISRDSHILNRLLIDGIDRNCEPDDIVTNFTKFITDRANPYFEKRNRPRKTQNFININCKQRQKWYTDECKKKHTTYIEALYNFNLHKNNETRRQMMNAKKDYKYYCRTCKLKYSFEQGQKINEMRKKQPREFWKLFKGKRQTETGQDVPINDFYRYFRSLSSAETPFESAEVDDFLFNFDNSNRNESTFSEVDEPITCEEIQAASRRLNSNKACSSDTILNEYLKEGIDTLLHPLEILFNYISNKKVFETMVLRGY